MESTDKADLRRRLRQQIRAKRNPSGRPAPPASIKELLLRQEARPVVPTDEVREWKQEEEEEGMPPDSPQSHLVKEETVPWGDRD